MAEIKAVDGAVGRLNGVAFPIPKGTTINIRTGNDQNLVATGTEMNGDGIPTIKYSVTSGGLEGLVFSIRTEDKEDLFNAAFAEDDHQFVLENGDTAYSMASCAFISPSEEGPPSIESNTRKTEAFNIVSQSGKVRRS